MLLQNSGAHSRRGMAGPGTLLLILVTLLLLSGERMSTLESLYYDFLQRQQQTQASDRILLIDTGAESASQTFWESPSMSPVIKALKAAGAAVIVPVEAPPAKANMPDIEQMAALAELEQRTRGGDTGTDRSNTFLADQLAGMRSKVARQSEIESTIKDAGNVVLSILERPTRQALEDAKNDCRQHALQQSTGAEEPWVRDAVGTLTLSNVLCNNATSAGFEQYRADNDGVVRRATLLAKSESRIFPSLSLAVAQAQEHADSVKIEGTNRLRMNETEIVTGPGFTNLIRYYDSQNGESAFKTISSKKLLSGEMPTAAIRDQIVLVGNMADRAAGDFRTPFAESVPMAIMLATTVSNLLQSDFIARPDWLGSAELGLLLLIGVLSLLLTPAMSPNRAALCIVMLVALLLATEAYLLIQHGIWVQLVTATTFTILGIGSIQAMNSLRPAAAANVPATGDDANATLDEDADELDLSFSVLRQQPDTDETKKKLYDIAMIHGKRREFAKAERVLAYIASLDPEFRDVSQKLDVLSGALSGTRKKTKPSVETTKERGKPAPGSAPNLAPSKNSAATNYNRPWVEAPWRRSISALTRKSTARLPLKPSLWRKNSATVTWMPPKPNSSAKQNLPAA
jgi:CHASE2 domain-containing sensor protein